MPGSQAAEELKDRGTTADDRQMTAEDRLQCHLQEKVSSLDGKNPYHSVLPTSQELCQRAECARSLGYFQNTAAAT